MTIQELYSYIGGNYDQAVRIMKMDRMISKYLMKLKDNPVLGQLKAACEAMDATQLFEAAHALKGVCANLGLDHISAVASEISEEFRPGNPRKHSDAEVKNLVEQIEGYFQKYLDGLKLYEESQK